MTLEQQYAQAVFDLVSHNPEKSSEYLKGLRMTLERKGHQKLMPRILTEYTAIIEKKERSRKNAEVSPQAANTRTLVELYRKLVATDSTGSPQAITH